ncbi:MAG: hypothetical protein SF053_05555 [Bacteroidia bacterium]|nr:hypothetical protein [Bacteroidia bacterium]
MTPTQPTYHPRAVKRAKRTKSPAPPVPDLVETRGAVPAESPQPVPQVETVPVSLPVITVFKAVRRTELGHTFIRLTWEVQGCDAISLLPLPHTYPAAGTLDLPPDEGESFTLEATNEAGTTRLETQVKIPAPRIHYFRADNTTIQLGYPMILEWDVDNATYIGIEGLGEVTGRSFVEVNPLQPGPVKLIARSEAGETVAYVHLELPLPEIQDFYASDDTFTLGQPITLFWEVSNTAQLSLSPEIGDVTGKTFVEIYPDCSTQYVLTATNASGMVTRTVQVILPPPRVLTFEGESAISTEGEPVLLHWQVENATAVTLEPGYGAVPLNGQQRVKPRKTQTLYTLTVEGPSGVVQAGFVITRFPIPLDEELLLEPLIFPDMPQHPDNQHPAGMKSQGENPARNAEAPAPRDIQIDRVQQMNLTEDMLSLSRPSVRTEFKKIVKKLKSLIRK